MKAKAERRLDCYVIQSMIRFRKSCPTSFTTPPASFQVFCRFPRQNVPSTDSGELAWNENICLRVAGSGLLRMRLSQLQYADWVGDLEVMLDRTIKS